MKEALLDSISNNLRIIREFAKSKVDDDTFLKIDSVIITDLHKLSYQIISADKEIRWDEVQGLYYFMNKANLGLDIFQSIYQILPLLDLQSEAIQEKYKEAIIGLYKKSVKSIPDSSIFQSILAFDQLDKTINGDYAVQYSTILYRFCEVIVKIDGKVTTDEESMLKSIYERLKINRLNSENNESINITRNDTETEILGELNKLVGLSNIKKGVSSLVNLLKVQKQREARGLPVSNVSLHAVFSGNPGTGKTTVARLLTRIYKALGFLEKGQLVETDRSGLVAGYVGQTAIKTTERIDEAMGGVLFIDEAYALSSNDSGSDYGKEAIDTLVKRMEDNRKDFIVIVAGYKNEMLQFINTNPGLKSRFNRFYEFEDFNETELLDMAQKMFLSADYKLGHNVEEKLLSLFKLFYETKDSSFGNGRLVRNIFEKTIENQANRIASIANLTDDILVTIEEQDVPPIN